MTRVLALLLVAGALSTHVLDVSEGTKDDFQAWARDEGARVALQAPLPAMMSIIPGMTQVSVRINPQVRDSVVKLFKEFPKGKRPLTHDEFAARWTDIETDLVTAISSLEALKIMESAGRKRIEEACLDRGIYKDATQEKGADASAYFLKGDTERKSWVDAVGWRNESTNSKYILELLSKKSWGRKLTEIQKTKICDFILILNQMNVTSSELENHLDEKWPQFKKKHGSNLPDAKELSEFLKTVKSFQK